jgi:uncharacterized protein YunC (DUF1805 family)
MSEKDEKDLQTTVFEHERGSVVCCDSAYDTRAWNRDRDIVVNASYCGVLPARFVGQHMPRGAIGVDCGIGREAAGIAGLPYLEALGVPGAVADVMTVELGNGVDLYETGVISRVNAIADQCGVRPGMAVKEAAHQMLEVDPASRTPSEVTNREVMHTAPSGRKIVCLDSIAFGLPEDKDTNVLLGAGHSGRSSVPYLRKVAPWGFIGSDGGGGKGDSGMAGIYIVEEDDLAVATVDARTACMGDGHSTYEFGVISAANRQARERGVEIGQSARDAAQALLGD